MSAGHWFAKWYWSKGPWFSKWHCRLAGSGNGRELQLLWELHLEETQGDFGRGAKVKMLQDIVSIDHNSMEITFNMDSGN